MQNPVTVSKQQAAQLRQQLQDLRAARPSRQDLFQVRLEASNLDPGTLGKGNSGKKPPKGRPQKQATLNFGTLKTLQETVVDLLVDDLNFPTPMDSSSFSLDVPNQLVKFEQQRVTILDLRGLVHLSLTVNPGFAGNATLRIVDEAGQTIEEFQITKPLNQQVSGEVYEEMVSFSKFVVLRGTPPVTRTFQLVLLNDPAETQVSLTGSFSLLLM